MQRKHSKASNEAKRVRAEMKSLATASERLEVHKANLELFQKLEEHDVRLRDRELLLELANLHDEGWSRFSGRFPSDFRESSMTSSETTSARSGKEGSLSNSQMKFSMLGLCGSQIIPRSFLPLGSVSALGVFSRSGKICRPEL